FPVGVTANVVALVIIPRSGVEGGRRHVLEDRGSTIRGLSMEGRMTVCNMTIESGARAGVIAPDDTTFAYLRGREYAPAGDQWDQAVDRWRRSTSDRDATFDREVSIDAGRLEQYVTSGTNPGQSVPVSGSVPAPTTETHGRAPRYLP